MILCCARCSKYVEFTKGVRRTENIREQQINEYIMELEAVLQNDNQNEEIKKMSDKQGEWLDKVEKLLMEKRYDLAEQLFYGVLIPNNRDVDTYWLNMESGILDWMFQVHVLETKSGTVSIFNKINQIKNMKDFYYELKFLIRRFEFDFPTELKNDIVEFIERYDVSVEALTQMIRSSSINKEKVCNELAVFLMEKGKLDSGESKKLLMTAVEERELKPYYCLQETERGKKEELPCLQEPEKEEKIAFIICVNKERFFEECCYYIKQLEVPCGYTVEIIPIYNAKSITSGYQMGMKQSDAKYKVYMHQDVMCIHKNMLYEALHVFQQDETIGLLGVAGCKVMPASGIWWEADMSESYYNLYQDCVVSFGCDNYEQASKEYENDTYQCVMGLDGAFLMTSQDIDWREDIFQGWHIYDVSQCMEFLRKGLKVVIPKTENLWIIHNEEYQTHLEKEYHQARLGYLKEYRKELVEYA